MTNIVEVGLLLYNNVYQIKKIDMLISKNYLSVKKINNISPVILSLDCFFSGDDIEYSKPSYDGHGLLSGGTYINSIDTIFESEVFLYNNNLEVASVKTIGGKFKFGGINRDLLYDVKAVALNDDFNPKTFKDVKPVDDDEYYKFDVYANYNNNQIQYIESLIGVYAYDAKNSNLLYSLDNAPVGVTINNVGVISLKSRVSGDVNFSVNVTDNSLNLTRNLPLSFNIKPLTMRYLPLSSNVNDEITGELWTSNGAITHVNGGMIAKLDSNITSTNEFKFDKDFGISFYFLKYSFIDNDNYYSSILSSGLNLEVGNKLSYIMVFSNTQKLTFRIQSGDKISNTSNIKEYQLYKADIIRSGNTISIYVDGVLETSVNMSTIMIDEFKIPHASPFHIGYNTWDVDTQKGGFGGIIKDFEYTYDYYRTPYRNNPKPFIYNIGVYGGVGKTSYGELPVASDVSILNNKMVFNGSNFLSFRHNSVNRMESKSYFKLVIKFTPSITPTLTTKYCLIDSLTSGGGYSFFVGSDGVYFSINTTYGVDTTTISTKTPFTIIKDIEYTLTVISSGGVVSHSINTGSVITTSGYIVYPKSNTLFNVGACKNRTDLPENFRGSIGNILITNEIIA